MTDCSNVEMRERLPEYLHGSLDAALLDRVDAHLATCADCRDELETLQLARAVMASVSMPAIDVAAIARALPSPATRVGQLQRPDIRPISQARPAARRSSLVLRLAAAITFISLGGISVAVTRAYFGGSTAEPGASTAAISPDTPTVAAVLPSESPAVGEGAANGLTLHAAWRELDDEALESLMGALDDLEAAPLAEPETTPGGRALDGSLSGSLE